MPYRTVPCHAAPHRTDRLSAHPSQILQSSEKKQRYQRKSSGANRGWLKKGPVGGARTSGGGPRSVVDDPLLGPPLAVEDERQRGWDEEEREEVGAQQALSPETSVPPSTGSRVTVPPVNGYYGGPDGVGSDPPPHGALPADYGAVVC